jgi:hypothetical protein
MVAQTKTGGYPWKSGTPGAIRTPDLPGILDVEFEDLLVGVPAKIVILALVEAEQDTV